MRILLDGKYHTEGTLQDARETELEDDPNFDVSRLSVDPMDLKSNADDRAVAFAAQMRDLIVGEPDALRRDGWTMKGVLAVVVLLRTKPELFDQMIIPAVMKAFTIEAQRRAQEETAEELMVASAEKMLGMLFATGFVEGNLRGLQKVLETASTDNIEAILAGAQEAAKDDFTLLQQSTV